MTRDLSRHQQQRDRNREIIRRGGAQSAHSYFPMGWQRELRSLVHNMLMKQCLLLYKAHRRPPRPPPQRKAGGASSPLSVGEEPQGRLPNPESGRWIWWEKEDDRGSPVFVPSNWSICYSHERSHRSAFFSFFQRKRDRHHEEQCLSSRQHTDCVYPQQRKFVCREEHTACNAICSRPSASFVALKAVVELILNACGRQTTPNKTHNRERQTHTE